MAEHPIIFSTEMVRAVLDDRKTHTRRIIKPQPIFTPPPAGFGRYKKDDYWGWGWRKNKNDWFAGVTKEQLISDKGLLYPNRCPYGKVGDTLWVRETYWYCCEGCKVAIYRADGEIDRAEEVYIGGAVCKRPKFKWKPSIHMFRWAARIFLEITNIRVERVQDITLVDIKAEGLSIDRKFQETKDAWIDLWNSLHSKRGDGWDKKPWVWVIEFKRVT